ncbi:MAG: hypothetical protein ACRDPW_01820 [Mycobacteriales bacterium]
MTTAYELPNDLQLPESAVDAAEYGRVVYLTHGDRTIALVPEQVALAGSAAIEAIQDYLDDLVDARIADERADEETVPWEQVKAELRELESQGR